MMKVQILKWITVLSSLTVLVNTATARTAEQVKNSVEVATMSPTKALVSTAAQPMNHDLRQFIGQNFMQPIESQLVRGSQ